MTNNEKNIIDQLPTLTEINKIVSERLRAIKNERNKETNEKITQKTIMEQTGLSKDVISRAYNQKGVSIPTAIALCEFFDISTDYLFGLRKYEDMEQSKKHYTIETLKKHLSIENVSNHSADKVAKISEPLETYLEVVNEYKNTKTMSAELKKQWIQEAESNFLNVIGDNPEEFIEYEKF